MPRILHLTLKKKWFDMIACGAKKEEYRELKNYWWTRLIEYYDPSDGEMTTKEFDIVRFRNGYSKDARTMDVKFIEIRIAKSGKYDWGWNGKCFGIVLGEILTIKE